MQPARHFEPIDIGHLHVQQNEIWQEAGCYLQRVPAILCQLDLVAFLFEGLSKHPASRLVIVNDQNASPPVHRSHFDTREGGVLIASHARSSSLARECGAYRLLTEHSPNVHPVTCESYLHRITPVL